MNAPSRIALALLAALLVASCRAAVPASDGADAACRVLQAPVALDGIIQTGQSAPPFRRGIALYTPLAGFSVAARVLARENYAFGRESDHSPTDFALGWGPMAEAGMAERLQITQSGRWYHYRWGREGPPMAPADIARHSANIHIVPANETMAKAIARVRAGEQLRLDGWLVRIEADTGWRWESSLSRDDTGTGSCEILLVCSVRAR